MTGMSGGTASTVRRKAAPSSQSNRAAEVRQRRQNARSKIHKAQRELRGSMSDTDVFHSGNAPPSQAAQTARARLWLEPAPQHVAENRWRGSPERTGRYHAIVKSTSHNNVTELECRWI